MRDAVAIIGSGAKFPGARDLVAFRRMIAAGSVHTSPVPALRWNHATVHSANPRHANKTPAQAGAFIDDIEWFAPEFFGVTPKRARLMDPQQRLMLEMARQALEDAGYARRVLADGRVGVYVGASSQDHRTWLTGAVTGPVNLSGHSGVAANLTSEEQAAVFAGVPAISAYTITGAQLNMIAANVSQAFDFRGPAFALDTACSSALAALHEAVLHLRTGIVDAALVGGVYTIIDPTMMVCFSRIGALSFTDRCAPFQTEANGFVLGEGAGAVVLKRLADAQRDGDRVVAVIRGVAMNNDGRGQGPLTPSASGQAAVMRDAWRDAGCDPASAGLLEAHATATQAGDGSELAALADVFGGAAAPVPVSSIKANIGHGLSSAGMASLLKAVCAVESGLIFPQPVSGPLRQELSSTTARLRVPVTAEAWKRQGDTPRRAGVSAFGFGGTNVHVVIEEPPVAVTHQPVRGQQRVTVSAPNRELLATYAGELASAVRDSGATVGDTAFTLATRRTETEAVDFDAADTVELIERLEQVACGETPPPATVKERSAGNLISLPPSPLAQRRYWLIDENKVARATAAGGGADVLTAEETVDGDDALAVVVASVCAVTAWQPGDVKPEHWFVADLGFDSLTTLELMTVLGRSLPGMTPPPRTIFTHALTVGELAGWIAAAPRATAETTGPAVVFETTTHAWLGEHRPGGRRLLPMAAMLQAARQLTGAEAVADFRVTAPVEVTGDRVALHAETGADGAFTLCTDAGVRAATGRTVKVSGWEQPLARADTLPGELSLVSFYAEFGFHGPALQALAGAPRVGATSVEGVIAAEGDAVTILDGALQLALYWLADTRRRAALVTGFADYRQLREWPVRGTVRCTAILTSEGADGVRGDFDLADENGGLIAQWRGVDARVLAGVATGGLPEVRELAARKAALAQAGFAMPYFQAHDGTAGAMTSIGGREVVNFSSYNYLGLAGDPVVNAAATAAVLRYGTSASASRVASGERPVHGELERALAEFLGCGGALATVSGHSINVALIGHLFGPEDLVIHDSLAHDSIVTGARLSGARRLAFAHNDLAALEALLSAERSKARRVLIAVEGVYSMDGDLAPLPGVVALKKKYDAMLLVDEAHSLGVLGATGAGAGEHFGVTRGDVDLWMGTLSKTLASCGGYVAGDAALIDYLKFTMPGFVYSVGLSPANAAAALAALQLLQARPGLPATLRERADFFRRACREQGVDIGLSAESAVVPCITGSSTKALRLAEALGAAGVNVQPIFYPAVEEGRARLRFFITAEHTEVQLTRTAVLLGRELAALNETQEKLST
ncbi:aminotransferase class I/II-fold pyridoxal phosphate-dependent enzyme [Rariglobus hedericola]|uniref:aminotransferase class I/II-fold pyridoxal phosphate-dependent enzyme n=1 Tax=Rariglobus hedericola TaxID=2597822 RepID=UPI00193A6697|nr:aminotransferase class I/II-fold pyridoxal phosphate-dependent enzyme [Rariglobus hedericola]